MNIISKNSKIIPPYYAVWKTNTCFGSGSEYERYSTYKQAKLACVAQNMAARNKYCDHDEYSVKLVTEDILKDIAKAEAVWNSVIRHSGKALRSVLLDILFGFEDDWKRFLATDCLDSRKKRITHKLWHIQEAGIVSAIRLQSHIRTDRKGYIELYVHVKFHGKIIRWTGSTECSMNISLPISAAEISCWANMDETVDKFFDVLRYAVKVFRNDCEEFSYTEYEDPMDYV